MILGSIAEGQQGQHVQPDVRLAVAHCLHAVRMRVTGGLPFVAEPSVCIRLVELASRVMASFAAVPLAASAASVLLPPISNYLVAVGGSTPACAQKLLGVRRSLLASVQLLLKGPSALLSAASVAERGPVIVIEAAVLAFSAITIATWARAATSPHCESRAAAQVLLRLQALLDDPTIATQLKERPRYPLCALACMQPINVSAQLVVLEFDLSTCLIAYIGPLFCSGLSLKTLPKLLADCQQQFLALSAAVERAALLPSTQVMPSEPDRWPASVAYEGAAVLANIAGLSAEALHHDPSSICQPIGLAAVVAAGAVSALAFAAFDSDCNKRPPYVAASMRGCMDYAAQAAKYLHQLAQQLVKFSSANAEAARSALTTGGAAQSLLQLLLWLSEPTTAIATASGVFQELI